MKNHKTNAFLKFFLTYFISVASLILAAGFFYFEQMKLQLMKGEHFSLIAYARHIKMNENLDNFAKDFHYIYVKKKGHISISNFYSGEKEFMKYIPIQDSSKYLQVFKSKKKYKENLSYLKIRIIVIQLFLLSVFAGISFFLARNALKPLKESLETLDTFTKDLIHDLNTPVTAMKLNIKLLEKQKDLESIKAFGRLKKSVDTISELHLNLTTLLENKTFQIHKLNLCTLVHDVIELHQPNYKNLRFEIECHHFEVKVNKNAFKQILHNLISNACKYNKEDGFIKIYTREKTLFIEDGGFGIQEPSKIFEREYSTQNSTGLGLDIVKRLCEAMEIDIQVNSSRSGSCFSLTFR